MPDRYCFEPCTREQAIAGDLYNMRMYWVRLVETGEISQWFERDKWPKGVEFVRPVESANTEHASLHGATDVAQTEASQ